MISRAEQGYEATLINDAESGSPRVPAGSAALLIDPVTFDANDRPSSTQRSPTTAIVTVSPPLSTTIPHGIVCFEMPELA